MRHRGVLLLQNFVLQLYRHATIHLSNGCRRSPFEIEDLSFHPSPNNISIYVLPKNQRVILRHPGVLPLRHFWLPIYGDATIYHSNECRHPPFAIEDVSIQPLTDNISIYLLAKNQRVVLKYRGVLFLRIFGSQYLVMRQSTTTMDADALPLRLRTSRFGRRRIIYQSTCIQKISA